MSHRAEVKHQFKDLELLQQAARQLGHTVMIGTDARRRFLQHTDLLASLVVEVKREYSGSPYTAEYLLEIGKDGTLAYDADCPLEVVKGLKKTYSELVLQGLADARGVEMTSERTEVRGIRGTRYQIPAEAEQSLGRSLR